jgi:hypothetical protein
MKCAADGCPNEVPSSRGSRARRWCSDACRKRESRRFHPPVAVAGGLAESTGQWLDDQHLDSPLQPFGELARMLAVRADAGDMGAAREYRLVMGALLEALEAESERADWFSPFELYFSILKEGIDPSSRLARVFAERGWYDLISHYTVPCTEHDHAQPLEFWRDGLTIGKWVFVPAEPGETPADGVVVLYRQKFGG